MELTGKFYVADWNTDEVIKVFATENERYKWMLENCLFEFDGDCCYYNGNRIEIYDSY